MQQKTGDPRVHSMFSGDCRWALFAVLALWLIYAFVFWNIMPFAGADEVLIALGIAGSLVLLFNTASILAMISHYSRDKEHIYGLDLHYLDAMKRK